MWDGGARDFVRVEHVSAALRKPKGREETLIPVTLSLQVTLMVAASQETPFEPLKDVHSQATRLPADSLILILDAALGTSLISGPSQTTHLYQQT